MPDWLRDVLLALVANAAVTLGLVAFVFVVYRLWGDRGVAWVLGKTEDEVRRMRQAPDSPCD